MLAHQPTALPLVSQTAAHTTRRCTHALGSHKEGPNGRPATCQQTLTHMPNPAGSGTHPRRQQQKYYTLHCHCTATRPPGTQQRGPHQYEAPGNPSNTQPPANQAARSKHKRTHCAQADVRRNHPPHAAKHMQARRRGGPSPVPRRMSRSRQSGNEGINHEKSTNERAPRSQ
jgi:hypothetical protein